MKHPILDNIGNVDNLIVLTTLSMDEEISYFHASQKIAVL